MGRMMNSLMAAGMGAAAFRMMSSKRSQHMMSGLFSARNMKKMRKRLAKAIF